VSDSETLANIEKRLSLGLMQRYEALMMIDPNLSEDQAKQKLMEIDNERMNSMRAALGMSGNSAQSRIVENLKAMTPQFRPEIGALKPTITRPAPNAVQVPKPSKVAGFVESDEFV